MALITAGLNDIACGLFMLAQESGKPSIEAEVTIQWESGVPTVSISGKGPPEVINIKDL
jgi:hypothetical protein